MFTHGSYLLIIGRLVTAWTPHRPTGVGRRSARAPGPTAGARPGTWRSSGTARRSRRAGTRRSPAASATVKPGRRSASGGTTRRWRARSRAPARRTRPGRARRSPSTTAASTPASRARPAISTTCVAGGVGAEVGAVGAGRRTSSRSRNARAVSGVVAVEHHRGEVEQHAVEQRGQVGARRRPTARSRRCRGRPAPARGRRDGCGRPSRRPGWADRRWPGRRAGPACRAAVTASPSSVRAGRACPRPGRRGRRHPADRPCAAPLRRPPPSAARSWSSRGVGERERALLGLELGGLGQPALDGLL